MKMTIYIKDLLLRTYVGVNADEKQRKQDVVINIKLSTDASRAIYTDDISNTYNYRDLSKKIIHMVENGRYNLLEKLCSDILNAVIQDNRVIEAEVEVDKPHALRFSRSVSVKMKAEREKN